jgi:hypothetical protein
MPHNITKLHFLIRLDCEGGSAEPGKAAIVRFAFNVLADHMPAKMSSEIDMQEPRSGKCRVVFDETLD